MADCLVTRKIMKYVAYIAAKPVRSHYPYIVYGPTAGLLGGCHSVEEARQLWDAELARCRERGKESDALLFEWHRNHWIMCGSLYDVQGAGEVVFESVLPGLS